MANIDDKEGAAPSEDHANVQVLFYCCFLFVCSVSMFLLLACEIHSLSLSCRLWTMLTIAIKPWPTLMTKRVLRLHRFCKRRQQRDLGMQNVAHDTSVSR